MEKDHFRSFLVHVSNTIKNILNKSKLGTETPCTKPAKIILVKATSSCDDLSHSSAVFEALCTLGSCFGRGSLLLKQQKDLGGAGQYYSFSSESGIPYLTVAICVGVQPNSFVKHTTLLTPTH